jgi:hypothetical protein
MRKLLRYILILLYLALLAACGDSQHTSPVASTMKAVIKMSAATSALNIGAINLIISVPVGVSAPLPADNNPVTAAATVEITSSAVLDQGVQRGYTYTPATTTSLGQISVFALKADGFTVATNDEIIIHLKVAPGTFPVASNFQLLTFDAFDINGAPVAGLSPTLTTTIQ